MRAPNRYIIAVLACSAILAAGLGWQYWDQKQASLKAEAAETAREAAPILLHEDITEAPSDYLPIESGTPVFPEETDVEPVAESPDGVIPQSETETGTIPETDTEE